MMEDLHEKTIEYLQTIKNDPRISESDYQDALRMLCEKILHDDCQKIDAEILSIEDSKNKCKSCGKILESWERRVCGPCRIQDPRFAEELDE